MSLPCYKLSIDLSGAFVNGFVERILTEKNPLKFIDIKNAEYFNQDWVDKILNQYRLPIIGAEVFYRSRNEQFDIHMDSTRDPDRLPSAAFNIVLHGGKESSMIWYAMPNEKPTLDRYVNPYWKWNKTVKFIEIYRDSVTEFSILRIDLPHAIENTEERVCVSFRVPRDFFESWEQAVEYVKPYIV